MFTCSFLLFDLLLSLRHILDTQMPVYTFIHEQFHLCVCLCACIFTVRRSLGKFVCLPSNLYSEWIYILFEADFLTGTSSRIETTECKCPTSTHSLIRTEISTIDDWNYLSCVDYVAAGPKLKEIWRSVCKACPLLYQLCARETKRSIICFGDTHIVIWQRYACSGTLEPCSCLISNCIFSITDLLWLKNPPARGVIALPAFCVVAIAQWRPICTLEWSYECSHTKSILPNERCRIRFVRALVGSIRANHFA